MKQCRYCDCASLGPLVPTGLMGLFLCLVLLHVAGVLEHVVDSPRCISPSSLPFVPSTASRDPCSGSDLTGLT